MSYESLEHFGSLLTAKCLRGKGILVAPYLLEDSMLILRVVHQQELELALDRIDKYVSKGDEVVAPSQSFKVHSVLATQREVPIETDLLLVWYVLPILLQVSSRQAEVDELDLTQRLGRVASVAHKDVVELEIVVDVPGSVYLLQNIEELDADLAHRLQRERFISLLKVSLKRLAELLHNNISMPGRLRLFVLENELSAGIHFWKVANVVATLLLELVYLL